VLWILRRTCRAALRTTVSVDLILDFYEQRRGAYLRILMRASLSCVLVFFVWL
jgi:hypothetical protein